MELSKMIKMVILQCLMVLTIAARFSAANDPKSYVNAHNVVRATLAGIGPMVWNHTLAAYAKKRGEKLAAAATCLLKHWNSNGSYGENLAWTSKTSLPAALAVKEWVSEKQYYNYKSSTCVAGKMCGHYTQVVWRNSVRLGCANVKCHNNRGSIVICNYDPPGNRVGEKPY